MIPFWKIAREWNRFKLQLQTVPDRFLDPRRQARHDAAFEAGFPIRNGLVKQTPRIAILVLFQPKGVPDWFVATCSHLVANGFAPLVVSNTPLSGQDHAKLAPVAWRTMVRPNFGYDFGGYRDGIRWLTRQGIAPEWLVNLNDSVWFPLYSDSTFLKDLIAKNLPVQGTNLRERGSDIKFLESYFYLLRGDVVASDVFLQYWETLQLTSNKYKVVRRCERGFSMRLRAAGTSLFPAFSQQAVLSHLNTLEQVDLMKVLERASYVQAESITDRGQLLAKTNPSRDDLLEHFEKVSGKELFYSSLPATLIEQFDYPMLKRSNNRIAALSRGGVLEAISMGELAPLAPSVQSALEQSTTLR